MKCKKHPRYVGIRYPWSECKLCFKIWRHRLENPRKRKKVQVVPADARHKADALSFGGDDIGGRCRMDRV